MPLQALMGSFHLLLGYERTLPYIYPAGYYWYSVLSLQYTFRRRSQNYGNLFFPSLMDLMDSLNKRPIRNNIFEIMGLLARHCGIMEAGALNRRSSREWPHSLGAGIHCLRLVVIDYWRVPNHFETDEGSSPTISKVQLQMHAKVDLNYSGLDRLRLTLDHKKVQMIYLLLGTGSLTEMVHLPKVTDLNLLQGSKATPSSQIMSRSHFLSLKVPQVGGLGRDPCAI